jgi:hypothetical protein
MKRFTSLVCAVLTSLTATGVTRADTSYLHYGGYQPWWNIFAKHNHMTCEEKRLQRFWHDYYDAQRRYYQAMGHIDWVAYYKNHGYQINGGGCAYGQFGAQGGCGVGGNGQCGYGQCGYGQCGPIAPIQFAPVVVNPPQMQMGAPNGACGGDIGGGMLTPGMPISGMPASGIPTSGIPTSGMSMPGMAMPGMAVPGMPVMYGNGH